MLDLYSFEAVFTSLAEPFQALSMSRDVPVLA